MSRLFIKIVVVLSLLIVMLSCSSGKESDDLAKGQKCLNEVPQDNPALAQNCLAYVEKYTSQQASILKCSILMTSGGLTETKIVKGYTALKSSEQTNKEASFMAVLSLDVPNVESGYSKAVQANTYCQQSGVPGLEYISGIILAGTYLNYTIYRITGSGLNINDPASINTNIQNMLATCTVDPPPATCTADIATLGTAVTSLSQSYCSGSNADQSVCTKINATTAAAGSDPTKVGTAIFCYLGNKTFNGTGCQ